MLILWTPAFLGMKNASIQPLSVSFISLGNVSPSHSTTISSSPSPDRLTSTENNSNIYINFSVVISLRNVYVANHFYHLLSRNIFCDFLSGIWNMREKKRIQSKLSTILTLKFNALIHHGPVWPVHLNLACIIDLDHVGEVFQHYFIEVNFHKMAAHLQWFKLDAVSLRGGFSYLGINFLTRRTCKYLDTSGL